MLRYRDSTFCRNFYATCYWRPYISYFLPSVLISGRYHHCTRVHRVNNCRLLLVSKTSWSWRQLVNGWILGIGTVYLCALIAAALRARKSNHSDNDFLLAGSSLGALVGCLTVAATLFSTFTLMGMPDLFRSHGIGAWFFLGISDCALAFVALWFGINIRRRISADDFNGFSGWLGQTYRSRHATYVYLFGIFVFLIPYVAIQIKGVSLFLNSIIPGVMPSWA